MKDVILQDLVPGDVIYNKNQIGVVYGETKSGEVRYYTFNVGMRYVHNEETVINKAQEDGFKICNNLVAFKVADVPTKKYTRSSDEYFKLSNEQYENYFQNEVPVNVRRYYSNDLNDPETTRDINATLKENYDEVVNDLRNQ